jgi:hypothetical protein
MSKIAGMAEAATTVSFTDRLLGDAALPYVVALFAILVFLFFYFKRLSASLRARLSTAQELSPGTRFDMEEAASTAAAARKALKFFCWALLLGYLTYTAAKGTSMQGYLMEWLNLLIRWTHVVAGIMWIGASFYFIFLENNLNRTKDVAPELAGNLWAIHGGGFYFLEKYKVAPQRVPKELHWFKYEAYFTWLSGLRPALRGLLHGRARVHDRSVDRRSLRSRCDRGRAGFPGDRLGRL